jgi:hypothetical protein
MIFETLSPIFWAKKWLLMTQNKAKLRKNVIITWVLEKNADFFSQKIAENIRTYEPTFRQVL